MFLKMQLAYERRRDASNTVLFRNLAEETQDSRHFVFLNLGKKIIEKKGSIYSFGHLRFRWYYNKKVKKH